MGLQNRLSNHWFVLAIIFSQAMFGLTFSSTQTTSYGYSDRGIFLDIFVDEPFIYTLRHSSFYALNACDLQPMTVVGKIDSPTKYGRIFNKYNNYLFLIRGDPGFFIELIDVSDPSNPLILSAFDFPLGFSLDESSLESQGFVTVNEQKFLFISDSSSSEFLCINYTIPTSPSLTSLHYFPGEAGDYYSIYNLFSFRDDHLFIPTKNDTEFGFAIYCFTAFNELVKVSEWFGETNISGVLTHAYCSGNYFCLDRAHMYLEIFDIQNLTAPTREGYLEFPANERPYFRDHYMIRFPGDWYKPNVTIWDLSDFSQPVVISKYTFPGEEYGEFNYEYFSDWMISSEHIYIPVQFTIYPDKELYVLDWSDPTNLTLAAILFFPDLSSGLFSFPLSGFTLTFLGTLTIFVLVIQRKRKLMISPNRI